MNRTTSAPAEAMAFGQVVDSCPPVLILAFNRPDTAAEVIESMRAVRPTRVFFAVDGARPGRAGEAEKVREVRNLANRIDWSCDVQTLFRDRNLGCKIAVSEAITWFFSQVEAGIILEDDCVAHPSFFRFTKELLERYGQDERIMMVSGNNFQSGTPRAAYSYYYSRYTHIWGWATWRRAWQLYDHRMTAWQELRQGGWLMDILGDARAVDCWTQIFDATHGERNTSWAYRWMYSAWIQNGLTVLPNANLVTNIGFGELATHTVQNDSALASLATSEMTFPLKHPPFVIRDERADAYTQNNIFSTPPLWRRIGSRVRRTLMGRR
ncbi:MAG TPA: glycosyltransferase family A protein [Burkholderiales bacterium]|nr:glycosyltransferase family A protein [Burkholderiales bacterium]